MGKTNRTRKEQIFAGGKGINVSTVLKNLGQDSIALGFTAGFTGEEFIRNIKNIGLNCKFIQLEHGFTRINVKMKGVEETEINGMGPVIDEKAMELLMNQLDKLREGDVLILSGSVSKSMGEFVYRDILARLSGKGIEFIVDATKGLLLNTLEYRPFLIKPNNHELGEIFGVELETRESVIPYARKLQEMGAKNVLVSISDKGAVLVDEQQRVFTMPAPKGTLVNAVGAGDSMVAGFLTGWMETQDSYEALKLSVSAGSATAFSEVLATKEEIQKVYNSLGDVI